MKPMYLFRFLTFCCFFVPVKVTQEKRSTNNGLCFNTLDELKQMDHCSTGNSTQPYFCPHNCMCFGHDQACVPGEDKIKSCLSEGPENKDLEWCRKNHDNNAAMPSSQCSTACYARFGIAKLTAPSEADNRCKTTSQNCSEPNKPYLCPYKCMCYGPDEACQQDGIIKCLPDEPENEVLEWCRKNHNNKTAMPSAQCSNACYARFPIDKLTDVSGSSNACCLWCCIPLAVIVLSLILVPGLVLVIGYYCRCPYSRFVHNFFKCPDKQTNTEEEVSPMNDDNNMMSGPAARDIGHLLKGNTQVQLQEETRQ